MGKYGLVHQLCNSLGSGERKHVHRDIDGSLEKNYFQGAGSGLSESQIYHIRQHKYAAPLKKGKHSHHRQLPFMFSQPSHCLLIISDKPFHLFHSLF